MVSVESVEGTKVNQGGPHQPLTSHYSFVDEHTIKVLLAEGPRFEGREAILDVSISAGKVILTDRSPSGDSFGLGARVVSLQRLR